MMAALISAICSVDGDIGTGGDRYSPPATLVWSPILTIAKVVGDRAEVGADIQCVICVSLCSPVSSTKRPVFLSR